MDHVVTVVVRPVEDAEVGPFAFGLLLRVAQKSDHVGALGVSGGENHYRYRRTGKLRARLGGFLLAGGLERHAVVRNFAVGVLGEYGRILVDQGEGAAENRRGGTAILFEDNALRVGEVAIEQLESRAGCSSKAIIGLVYIAH